MLMSISCAFAINAFYYLRKSAQNLRNPREPVLHTQADHSWNTPEL